MGNSEVEVLNKESGFLKWKKLQKYPFHSSLFHSSLVSINDSIIVLGGQTSNPSYIVSSVAKFKDNVWTGLGNLNQARHGHNSITFNSDILIVGGQGTLSTEVWNLEDNQSSSIDPTLTDYKNF